MSPVTVSVTVTATSALWVFCLRRSCLNSWEIMMQFGTKLADLTWNFGKSCLPRATSRQSKIGGEWPLLNEQGTHTISSQMVTTAFIHFPVSHTSVQLLLRGLDFFISNNIQSQTCKNAKKKIGMPRAMSRQSKIGGEWPTPFEWDRALSTE